ncbi:MAG TPA: class I SAM-dependent methyltransferase [Rhizomicrobium sp.]|jgi:2-polyprenyl-3-methyl-5-hydroxy-6-metoxy-1,4-benzoquinol methylase|nr:class I SAM-dependent methyltransferase [Rhizomicrobium sp.]
MDVKEEELLGGSVRDHWYYRSKRLALDSMLRDTRFRRVLDIGAGSAVFSKHLLQRGAETALCVDSAYAQDHSETYDGKPIRFVRAANAGDADLVLLMDVLEHVDNDVQLIRSSVAGAAGGAHVLISVPAFQSLFSAHDRFLEHRRRYTIRSLEAAVTEAGLKIVSTRYFFAMILPLVAAMRVLERKGPPKSSLMVHSGFVNAVLTLAHRVELPFFRYNRFGGLSVFCLARVP